MKKRKVDAGFCYDIWFSILEYCDWNDIITKIQFCFRDVHNIIHKHPHIMKEQYERTYKCPSCEYVPKCKEECMRICRICKKSECEYCWEGAYCMECEYQECQDCYDTENSEFSVNISGCKKCMVNHFH